jgi:hypothetical protein
MTVEIVVVEAGGLAPPEDHVVRRQSRNQTGNPITGEAGSRRPTMTEAALTDRYAANLHGVLSCYDRIIITGTLPGACYAGGMTSFLFSRGIRIFDYPRFAEPLHSRTTHSCPRVAPCPAR